jgi:2-oxoglutarate dehydrogenase E2 component (dihydrolipoamide succinyltransferase)
MSIDVQIPPLGESITQATLIAWKKRDGEHVSTDEPICELETDKANVDLPAQASGILHHLIQEGQTVNVGQTIARIDEIAVPAPPQPPPEPQPQPPEPVAAPSAAPAPERLSHEVRRIVEEHDLDPRVIPHTGPAGRLTKQDVQEHLAEAPEPLPIPEAAPPAPLSAPTPAGAGTRREPMSRIRRRVAERLVQAQHTAAILTTFNEIDLSEVLSLRGRYKDRFQEVHGVSLGLMSFFARAVVLAVGQVPSLNAFIEGDDIVYHDYVNLGIAVSTERGLAVPVLHNVQDMSFAQIEGEIKRVSTAVRDGKLGIEDLSGGTFTITNGGVFGSLLSTPILTPPQSGILGMHNIQKRPVVINDKVEIRSMMYVAVSYDHRLVDGKDAITFLVRVKQFLEDPARLMLEI